MEDNNIKILNTITSACRRLNSTNSSKEKQDLLGLIMSEPDSEILTKALMFAYSPYITFGVTSDSIKKWMTSCDDTGDLFATEMPIWDLLESLAVRELTGHDALRTITNTIFWLPGELKDTFYNIIDKNLKIRMDAKSINKVIPDLIPVFEVSLCNVYGDKKSKVDFKKDEWYASRKMDGCVSGDTLITVEGGKFLPIKTIVENHMDIKVLTYDTETKKEEYKSIKNYMKNIDDINESTHQWFELELEDGRKLKVTGNHRIYIPEIQCWRRVDELNEGDKLFII